MYDLTALDKDLSRLQPRFFDTWILPGFLIWYALTSKEKKRRWRRMLFGAGIWAFYRNYTEYKKVIATVASNIQGKAATNADTDLEIGQPV